MMQLPSCIDWDGGNQTKRPFRLLVYVDIQCIIRAGLVTHNRSVSMTQPGGGGGGGSYRCFLTLDGGAVEAEGGHVVGLALDVKDALVVPLSRLGLGEVLGSQRDGLGHPHGDVDLGGGQNLWTVLRGEEVEPSQRRRRGAGRPQNAGLLGKREKRRKQAEGSDAAPEPLTPSA